jgi:hypothetical protein
MGRGASRPFLARSDQDELLVVKPHAQAYEKTALFTKPLFNEFVCSSLARTIGLPWPDVSIVLLETELINQLKQVGFSILSEWAVGLSYIPGLKPYLPLRDSGENAKHMNDLFPDPRTHAVFYGKSVFDNWILLEDWKYDTLQIQENGSPIFLDASMAFWGLDWDVNRLQWTESGIHLARSPYLSGFVLDQGKFLPWLEKLGGIASEVYSQILQRIPKEWSVPPDYVAAISELLTVTHQQFVPLFEEAIEWEKESQLI